MSVNGFIKWGQTMRVLQTYKGWKNCECEREGRDNITQMRESIIGPRQGQGQGLTTVSRPVRTRGQIQALKPVKELTTGSLTQLNEFKMKNAA